MPTRRTPRRRPRAPAAAPPRRAPARPGPVPDGVLRQPATPPGDPGVDRRVGDAEQRRSGRRAPGRPARRRRAGATASSPRRPTEARTTTTPARLLGVPAPLRRGERHGLHRPALDRRHQEAGAWSAGSGNAVAGKASATTAIDAYADLRQVGRCRRHRAARSSRAAGAAGTARTTASASTCSALRVGPDRELPARRRTAQLADRRAGAHVALPTRRATASGAGRRRHGERRRPRRRRAGRLVGLRPAGSRGREQRALPPGVRRELRHGRLQGQLVGASRVDAAEQRLHQPVHHGAARAGRPT